MAIAATPQTALSVVEGDTDFIGPQVPQTLDNVELTTDFPRVTLTTVVAPSPDWFVGVCANGQCDLPGNGDPTNAVPLAAPLVGSSTGDGQRVIPGRGRRRRPSP